MTKRTPKSSPPTNLPATLLEAEAREFGRSLMGRFCEPGCFWFDSPASRLFMRRYIREMLELDPLAAAGIVEDAVLGSAAADQALREVIAEKSNRGEPLGAVLAAYNIRLLNPGISRRRGKSGDDNFLEDVAIAAMVWFLIDRFPLKPTRSQIGYKRQPSGCSVIAAILTEAGQHRGDEKAVQAIWNRYAPRILPRGGRQWPGGQNALGFKSPT